MLSNHVKLARLAYEMVRGAKDATCRFSDMVSTGPMALFWCVGR
jgi:hypothetical protein